ncbi:hypothetical protein B0T26DRAFT_866475 [Lasiosphaeria miniovina]|uniref:Uncharacterized protein n=1 Tax=Lasiosphaeria miniovina TaxID=1954250 RepID=A0AA40BF86_9PEZI|nr:uncharacterized protein B0T26DRAFT_866475 [Lasiosphaeria miniovina]KAK0733135.1 hypothetical protein B0T26DRAFT_866475 [Lasiosphaeria miniovina]
MFESVTPAQLSSGDPANVRAPLMLVQAVLPHIPRGGRIINISSLATRTVNIGPGIPPMPLYVASKLAVEGLTQNWAVEFGQSRGITSNAVSVGFVEADLIAAMPAEQKEQIKAGNIGGEGARWVTGSTVSANGGATVI